MQSSKIFKFCKTTIKKVPQSCGVYLFYSSDKDIIYIGKSVNLNSRINSYLYRGKANQHVRKKRLIHNIHYFKYIVVKAELSALLLEDNLIKQYRPEYNVKQNEFQEYTYLEITEDTFPAIKQHESDSLNVVDQSIFGPLKDIHYYNKLKEHLTYLFHIRSCNDKIPKQKCINYKINQCSAPCREMVDKDGYDEIVKKTINFLQGECSEVLKILQNKLTNYNHNLDYENSALIRDRIIFCTNYCRRQKFINNFFCKNLLIKTESEFAYSYLFNEGKLLYSGQDIQNIEECKQKIDCLSNQHKTEGEYVIFDRANIVYSWLNKHSKNTQYNFFV